MTQTLNKERLTLVDALRGFALLAIVLLHNLEHYNLYYFPENLPSWMKTLDSTVWNTTFFLMAGKAFSTFSLLFGFSFFIQLSRQSSLGKDFRLRFAWRMIILIIFAQLHALIYNGDILLMYAITGLLLIPVARLSDKWVFAIAVFLLLQPFEWGRLLYAAFNPDFTLSGNFFIPYAEKAHSVMINGNFPEMVYSNITDGQLYNNLWQIENGRLFQIPALFMFGMLLGRKGYFIKNESSIKFWRYILVLSALVFIPLYLLKTYIPPMIERAAISIPYNIAVPSLFNFCFMCLLVSLFVLTWFHKGNGYKIQRFIVPYGQMSLTNYISQSLIGCAIYLNWGVGLYQYTGAIYCIMIGLLIFSVQLWFSSFWLSRFKQGPFEWLWKKATWIKC